jgi:hypothetical protein
MVMDINGRGFDVTNRQNGTRPAAYSDLFWRCVSFYTQLKDQELVPDAVKLADADPIVQTGLNTAGVAAVFEFFETDPKKARKIHGSICDKFGISKVTDLNARMIETFPFTMLSFAPRELQRKLEQRIDALANRPFDRYLPWETDLDSE